MTTVAVYQGKLYTDSKTFCSPAGFFYQTEDIPGKGHIIYQNGKPVIVYAYGGYQAERKIKLEFEALLLEAFTTDAIESFINPKNFSKTERILAITKDKTYTTRMSEKDESIQQWHEISNDEFAATGSGACDAYVAYFCKHPLEKLMVYVNDCDKLTSADTYIYDSAKLFPIEISQ